MKKLNLSLLLGALALLPVIAAAAVPQLLAPHNPTDFHQIVDIGGTYVRAPFPVFATREYLLGSDPFGRDTLSRLIWAVRPTLTMVLLVTFMRVVIGALFGVVLGWSTGLASRVISGLLRVAQSVPVFLVALAVIAALQNRLGASAFVIGLCMTGWAEIAAFCAAQTQLIKRERFVEAAHALGEPDWQIVAKHVIRQLVPSLRTFFVLEIGSVLIALSGLALLGYFASGSNWVMVTDFEAQRVSAAPDLPEMLGSAVQVRWMPQMLVTGGALVAITLAFNIFGEGLRAQLVSERKRRTGAYAAVSDFFQSQQDRISEAMAQRRVRRAVLTAAGVMMLVAACTVGATQLTPVPAPALVNLPAGQIWSSDRRDANGSLRGPSNLSVTQKPSILWEKALGDQISGSPAIGADGTIYVATVDKRLHALSPNGEIVWSAFLEFAPIGAVGLNPAGDAHIADELGGLTAYNTAGNVKWSYRPTSPRRAIAGPVFDADGNAYVTQDGYMVSVDPRGFERWSSRLPYTFFSAVPRVDGRFVFFKDLVFSARTGKVLVAESPDDLDQFITGADGKFHLMSQTTLFEWQTTADGAALAKTRQYEWIKEFPGRVVADATVWPDGSTWLLLTSGQNDSRVVWVGADGKVTGSVQLPVFAARFAGMNEIGNLFVCGELSLREVRCDSIAPRADKPAWSITLPADPFIGEYRDAPMYIGGALAGDKLVVATLTGRLYALGDPEQLIAAAPGQPSQPVLVPVTPAVPMPASETAMPLNPAATATTSDTIGFFPSEPVLATQTPLPTVALTLVAAETETPEAITATVAPAAPAITNTTAITDDAAPIVGPGHQPGVRILRDRARCCVAFGAISSGHGVTGAGEGPQGHRAVART